MERRVSVNAGMGSKVTPDGIPVGWSQHEWQPEDDAEARENEGQPGSSPAALQAGKAQDFGPCLYLGPGGQRCSRRALSGGFCRVHTTPPAGKNIPPERVERNPVRFWAAAGAIIALLWPYIELVVREILRWARSH